MRILSHSGLCEKHRKLLVMLTIVFLLSTLFTSQSAAAHVHISCIEPKNIGDNTEEHDGYIIQFKEEPLSIFRHRFKNNMKNVFSHLAEKFSNMLLNQNIIRHKNKLLSIHSRAKEDISRLIGEDYKSGKIFTQEFTGLFNGMAIKKVPNTTLEAIKGLSYVKNVVPDYKISVALDESIPLINADNVWYFHDAQGKGITGKDVSIAIIDTGVDYTHPDLEDNYMGGFDFVNNDEDPMDDNGHGTHCAGIAVGTGKASGYEYVGVAPGAELYVYKVLNNEGNGTTSWFIAGMEKAVDPNSDGDFSDHVDIISISAGNSSGNPDDPLSEVADNAVENGVVVVAAAGNDGPSEGTISSPGCARKVICVGVTDKNDVVTDFSSRGPVEWNDTSLIKPDVVAPGVSIMSTRKGGGYIIMSGASMATPHVAGAAALLKQMHREWNPDEIKMALNDMAIDLGYDSNTQGSGRINISVDLDQEVIIKSPYRINEEDYFTVNVKDKNGAPIKICALFIPPRHLPRLRYGSSVTFKAPMILNPLIESLECKIIVFKVLRNYKVNIDITVVNNKFILH